ncbi:MAG: 2,3-bisphosphoglycerate-independent phosphoglycerate mutase [Bacteroidota bacterium]|nr:2,3-bisphosphoglycerate-independent phosphoglycerate mutase [Bacteroidota bacterium]
MQGKKTVLLILDGWGHGDQREGNAIHYAKTPFIDSLYHKYPHSELLTSGQNVGLPEGQMGNSEVGHLNIGAGRIVYQDLEKINNACIDGSIAKNKNLQKAFHYSRNNNKPLHLIGLVSDGGVHSHQDHLYKLCKLAQQNNVKEVFIHAFTDGRDTDPKKGKEFITKLESNLHGAKIASVCGRYYAMDRDKRWERIAVAYNLLTNGIGEKSKNILEAIQNSYDNGITDEFIKPIIKVNENNIPITKIQDQDAVICFNFRTDRCRQITNVLTQENISEYSMKRINLNYTTMTNYDNKYKNVNVIFKKENLKNTLGEVLSSNHRSQIRIAETEKYPHVTFFFSGGQEEKFKLENRFMVPSPRVTTYDLEPEMSAYTVTATIISELKKGDADFVCLNFANADMVGHTGDYDAIVRAVQTVDICTKKVVHCGLKHDYAFIIISDHGNAELTINNDGTPHTAHTINPVPCFVLNADSTQLKNGILADIAPTILDIMGIKKPEEMTGKSLII